MDFVKSLGTLTLAHRFHRLVNRLLDAHEAVYRPLGLPIKPRWVSTLLLLHTHGPLGVTDIAERLALTHPAVSQLAQEIAAAELIADAKDERDGRRRLLRLTPEAVELMPVLQRVWAELASAQQAVFTAAGCDILAVLDSVEERLDQTPLSATVLERLGGAQDPPGTTRRRQPRSARSRSE